MLSKIVMGRWTKSAETLRQNGLRVPLAAMDLDGIVTQTIVYNFLIRTKKLALLYLVQAYKFSSDGNG